MGRKVAITGIGQTKTKLKRKDVNFFELMGEAARQVIEDLGLTIDDIDCVICSSSPEFLWNKQTEMFATDFTLWVMKPHYRIQTRNSEGLQLESQAGIW